MSVKYSYEWKETRSGRRFVRTPVSEPAKAPKLPPAAVAEPEPLGQAEPEAVADAQPVEEQPKPKRGRPRKAVADD